MNASIAESTKSFRQLRSRDVTKNNKCKMFSRNLDNATQTLCSLKSTKNSMGFKEVLLDLRRDVAKLDGSRNYLSWSERIKVTKIRQLLKAFDSSTAGQCNDDALEMIESMSQDMGNLRSTRGRKKKIQSTHLGENSSTPPPLPPPLQSSLSKSDSRVFEANADVEPPVAQKAYSQLSQTSPSVDDLIKKAHADALELWARIDEQLMAEKERGEVCGRR